MALMIGHMRDGKFIPGPPPEMSDEQFDELVQQPSYETGRLDPLSDVIAWARKNPLAWTAVVRWAHQDRASDFNPSTRLYACILRRPHFARRLGLSRMAGEQFLINDHLTSGLARLLNREYPHLKIPTREAKVDSW